MKLPNDIMMLPRSEESILFVFNFTWRAGKSSMNFPATSIPSGPPCLIKAKPNCWLVYHYICIPWNPYEIPMVYHYICIPWNPYEIPMKSLWNAYEIPIHIPLNHHFPFRIQLVPVLPRRFVVPAVPWLWKPLWTRCTGGGGRGQGHFLSMELGGSLVFGTSPAFEKKSFRFCTCHVKNGLGLWKHILCPWTIQGLDLQSTVFNAKTILGCLEVKSISMGLGEHVRPGKTRDFDPMFANEPTFWVNFDSPNDPPSAKEIPTPPSNWAAWSGDDWCLTSAFFPTENAIIEIIVHTVDTENVRSRNLEFLEFLEFLAGHARWIFQRTTSPLRP